MIKKLLLMCLCIATVLCLAACNKNLQESEEYFYEINEQIKDEDFCTAKVKAGKILLYDSQQKLIQEQSFDKYDKSITLLYVRKEGTVIFFVTSGAVDDEYGILFINDNSNSMLDGINSIKRIGRNSYQYDTSD